LFSLFFIYFLFNRSITSFLFYVHFIPRYSETKTVRTELKQCIKLTHTCKRSTFNSRVLRNYTKNSMPCLATRSKVDSSIPKNEKNTLVRLEPVTFGSRALRGNPFGHTGTVKPHTCIEYINIMMVQQTCAILDDCQRLHYWLLILHSYLIHNIFLHKGQVGVIVRMLYMLNTTPAEHLYPGLAQGCPNHIINGHNGNDMYKHISNYITINEYLKYVFTQSIS